MSEDAHSGWLPPQAPGADPPRRWESMPEAAEAAPHPSPVPEAAPYAPVPQTDWWGQDAAAPPPQFNAPPSAARPAGNGAAVASLILGVAGLVLFFFAGF